MPFASRRRTALVLGFDKPKGCFNVGITKELYIFQLLIEHTLDIVRAADAWIPLYIMTSNINYQDTVTFFEAHDYFGYNPAYVHFFVQELNPATDFNGKILLKSKYELALSPNGNGGWFSSMHKAGLLEGIFEPIWNGSMYFLWTMYCSGLPIRYS